MTAKWGREEGSAGSTRWSSPQTVYREENESNRQRQRPKRRRLEFRFDVVKEGLES